MTGTEKRRYWGFLPADVPATAIAAQAKMQEDAGLDGVLAAQLYSTPFIPLAIAAAATNRIRLLSGIALAFTRSPYETALAAMDMDPGERRTLHPGPGLQRPGVERRHLRHAVWEAAGAHARGGAGSAHDHQQGPHR